MKMQYGCVAVAFLFLLDSVTGLKMIPYRYSYKVQQSGPASGRNAPHFTCRTSSLQLPGTSTSLKSVAVSVSTEIQNSAIRAVTKLLVTCGIGASSAKRGILDQKAIEVLSKLVFNLFQPCLLFVNVAQTIAAEASVQDSRIGYLLPFAAVIQITIGFTLGKLISLVIYDKKPTSESKQFLACTTFANSGPLPLGRRFSSCLIMQPLVHISYHYHRTRNRLKASITKDITIMRDR